MKLQQMTARSGLSSEELVRISSEDLLAQPEQDYQQAADYVLKKNAELYRWLA